MEKTFTITASSEEMDILARYSCHSIPKMWHDEKYWKGNLKKYKVTMRIPEESQIENGKTYSFLNYLKRTNDIPLLSLLADIKEAVNNYGCAIINQVNARRTNYGSEE